MAGKRFVKNAIEKATSRLWDRIRLARASSGGWCHGAAGRFGGGAGGAGAWAAKVTGHSHRRRHSSWRSSCFDASKPPSEPAHLHIHTPDAKFLLLRQHLTSAVQQQRPQPRRQWQQQHWSWRQLATHGRGVVRTSSRAAAAPSRAAARTKPWPAVPLSRPRPAAFASPAAS